MTRLRRMLNTPLYRLAWWASMRRYDWLAALIYRYRCPCPISDRHFSVRACNRLGDCGCDNMDRFPQYPSFQRMAASKTADCGDAAK